MYRGKKNRFEEGAEVLVFETLADADEVLKLLNVKSTMSQGRGRITKPGRGFFTFLASLNDVSSKGRAPQNGFAVAARVILSAFRDQAKPIPSILVDDQGGRTADTWPKSLHKSKIITKAEADLDRAVQADAPLTTWTERWSCRVKRSRQENGGMSRGSKQRLAMIQLHDLKQILSLLEYTNRTRKVAFSRPHMAIADFASFAKNGSNEVLDFDTVRKGYEAAQALVDIAEAWA
ncbi:Hypothetical Protein FCC1311_113662, partial [Hondaea fermentalgiana]